MGGKEGGRQPVVPDPRVDKPERFRDAALRAEIQKVSTEARKPVEAAILMTDERLGRAINGRQSNGN